MNTRFSSSTTMRRCDLTMPMVNGWHVRTTYSCVVVLGRRRTDPLATACPTGMGQDIRRMMPLEAEDQTTPAASDDLAAEDGV
jgi:hypothetical protein